MDLGMERDMQEHSLMAVLLLPCPLWYLLRLDGSDHPVLSPSLMFVPRCSNTRFSGTRSTQVNTVVGRERAASGAPTQRGGAPTQPEGWSPYWVRVSGAQSHCHASSYTPRCCLCVFVHQSVPMPKRAASRLESTCEPMKVQVSSVTVS